MSQFQLTIEELDKSLNDKCVLCLKAVETFENDPIKLSTAGAMEKFDLLILNLKNIRFEYIDFKNRLRKTNEQNNTPNQSNTCSHSSSEIPNSLDLKIEEINNNINLLEKTIFHVEDTKRYFQIKIYNDTSMAFCIKTLLFGNGN